MLVVFAYLRGWLVACLACLRAYVLTYLACLHAYVLGVLGVLTCLRACVLGVLACVRACYDEMSYFLTCLRTWCAFLSYLLYISILKFKTFYSEKFVRFVKLNILLIAFVSNAKSFAIAILVFGFS